MLFVIIDGIYLTAMYVIEKQGRHATNDASIMCSNGGVGCGICGSGVGFGSGGGGG